MKLILTVNYNQFVLPEGTDINNLVKALAGNLVEREFSKSHGDCVFWPSSSECEIKLQVVNDDLVLLSKPAEKLPPLEPTPEEKEQEL